MDQTARFALPFLAPGQVHKEWFVNESLQLIDMLLCPVVEELPLNDPPADAAPGQCFVVGDAPTGEWAGQAGAIAGFSDGGWRFVKAPEGARLLVRSAGETILRRAGAWEAGVVRVREVQVAGQAVLRARQASIGAPAGGAVIDAEARSAIAAIIAAMEAHGLIETLV